VGLEEFRAEIDDLDDQVVRALARRFAVCRDVAEFKARSGVPMMHPARVGLVKQRAADRARRYGLPVELVESLYDAMVSAICTMENEIIADRRAHPVPPPVFLGGDDRSGTTLLSVVLDSHPALAMGPELDYELPPDLGPQLRECLRLAIADDPRVSGPGVQTADPAYAAGIQLARQVRRFGVDHPTLDALVRQTMCRTGSDLVTIAQRLDLVDAIGRTRAAAVGKPCWGIKIQRRIAHPEPLLRRWPDARFVHLVRDGRDVAASQLRGGRGWGYESITAAAAGWAGLVDAVPAAVPAAQLYELRYEDLVADPEPVLRELLGALGLNWDPVVLRHTDMGHALFDDPFDHPSADAVRRPIGTTAVGRHRRDLTPEEQRTFATLAGATLRRRGYQAVPA
jgi:chorismate mutase